MPEGSDEKKSSNQLKTPETSGEQDTFIVSRKLVDEIRERLEQLERVASLPEQKLTELEGELQEAYARLQAERLQFAKELEDAERKNTDRLLKAEQRLEEYLKAANDHKKQIEEYNQKHQELSWAVESLTRQRDDAVAAFDEYRRQIERRPQQLQKLNEQLAESQNLLAVKDKQIADLKESLAKAHESRRALSLEVGEKSPKSTVVSEASGGLRNHLASPKRTVILVVGMIMLLTLSILLSVSVYRSSREPLYRLNGMVLAPTGNAEVLADCQAIAAAYGDVRIETSEESGVGVWLSMETTNLAEGREKLNTLGESIVSALQSSGRPPSASRPSESSQRDRLIKRLSEIESRLKETTSQPASDSGQERTSLLASWQAAQTERERILKSVAELSGRIESKPPDQASVQLDSTGLKSAEQADQKFLTDVEALNQRKEKLAEMLKVALGDGKDCFDELAGAANDGDMHLAEALQAGHADDVNAHLRVMRKSLTEGTEAAAKLAETWRENQAELAQYGDDVDPLACQTDLEQAARTFMDTKAAVTVRFHKALESIGQGGDQPTKRIVLRNKLTGQMQKVMDGLENVQSAARSVMLAHNVPLAAVVQSVAGLHSQVQNRRSSIETALREQILADIRSEHERQVSEARAQRDRLSRRAAQLDQDIIKFATQALELVARNDGQSATLLEQIDLMRLRANALAEIVRLDESHRQEPATMNVVRYIPPPGNIEPITPVGRRLAFAVLVGGIPLLAVLLLGAIIWCAQGWLRSRRSMTDYIRDLQNPFKSDSPTIE